MNQPTPTVSRLDVERVVRRDFPSEAFSDVMSVLDGYGTESFQREKERVQLAVLKLAGGSHEKLRRGIEEAKCDYRDVLSPAEFPGYSKRVFRIDKVPEEDRRNVIDSDWKQYSDWLTRWYLKRRRGLTKKSACPGLRSRSVADGIIISRR